MYRKNNYTLIWKLPFSQRIKEGKEKEMKAEEEKEKERDKKSGTISSILIHKTDVYI